VDDSVWLTDSVLGGMRLQGQHWCQVLLRDSAPRIPVAHFRVSCPPLISSRITVASMLINVLYPLAVAGGLNSSGSESSAGCGFWDSSLPSSFP
jgi:hypothetical protein